MSDPQKHIKPQPVGAGEAVPVDDARTEHLTEADSLDPGSIEDGCSAVGSEMIVKGAGKASGKATSDVDPKADQAMALEPDELESLIDAEWLGAQFAQFSDAVANMTTRFDVVATQSKRVHEINGELHSQLQSVRGNAILEMMRPGFSGFVRLIGQLDTDIERLRTADDSMASVLVAYRISLANALQDCGLSEDPETLLDESVEFSPSSQEINAVVQTDDPNKDRKIARVALPGFSFGDSRLFREKVDVYRYIEPGQQE